MVALQECDIYNPNKEQINNSTAPKLITVWMDFTMELTLSYYANSF